MSLFKTKEWWRTECGVNECFDRHSLLVAPLFGADNKDVIVVASHAGYLRIYSPTSQWTEETKAPTGYKSTDLIIEMRVSECIVDVKAGKFVSGSQDLRLAILTPKKLIVYTAILHKGSMEHGDRCDLEVAYEHELARFPASLTCGPFGGVRGRDFLCVQCLDGTLLFYEQESYAFGQSLKNRLLPEPIVYVSRNDVFVTSSSSWFLECYRYQNLADFGRNKDEPGLDESSEKKKTPKNLEPDWSYNIGEAVLDICAVTLSSFEVGIVVLGEKNLYCLRDNCATLKYSKRLEYKALCFRAYVIEPDGKLMVLVIADTSTLMIYEGTTLKWSAQLPFAPVSVARAHLEHLDGTIVVLSDEGRLECCYLGSEPSLFIAPPLNRRGFDSAATEEELQEIRRASKKSKTSNDRLANLATDAELIVILSVSNEVESKSYDAKDDSKDETEGRSTMCRLSVDLSSYTSIKDVQICVEVFKPSIALPNCHFIANLCDRYVLQATVYTDGGLPPVSSEVRVTVTYETDRGSLRVLQKTAQLPPKMFLRACPPENTSAFTATIKSNEPVVSWSQLFPEFVGDHLQGQNWNALGLQHVQTGHVATIVSGASSNRYRVQTNDSLAMTLVVQLLVNRLKDKSGSASLSASISQSHVQLVHTQIEAHFLSRQEVDKITSELALLTTQLRNIERRMLRAVRERNSRSLADTGLPFLLESTYRSIFKLLDDLAAARAIRERASHCLQCALRLLLILLRLNLSDDKYAIVESAIGFEPQLDNEVDWEEIADVALATFLRLTSRKTSLQEPKQTSLNKYTSAKDLGKLKKRLIHMVERLDACREADIVEHVASGEGSLASG